MNNVAIFLVICHNVFLRCVAVPAIFHGFKNVHLTPLISVAAAHKDNHS